jgi:hypothetical protein
MHKVSKSDNGLSRPEEANLIFEKENTSCIKAVSVALSNLAPG